MSVRPYWVSLTLLAVTPAVAAPTDGVCKAAHALETAQRDLPDQHGLKIATWEWQRGTGLPADNTAGIVALALAETTAHCASSEALGRYAKARTDRHAASEFLFDADAEALAVWGRISKDKALIAAAREAFERRYEGASGEEIVARWFMMRKDPSLVGFDAAQAIRAGVAVGDETKAREIAAAVARTSRRWAEAGHGRQFLIPAQGALLEALAKLPGNDFTPLVRDLSHHLILAQESDGSFGVHSTQATAYAVRGLRQWPDEANQTAAEHGKTWLEKTQLGEGEWALYGDRRGKSEREVVSEVTAEAVLALVPDT